MRYRVYYNRAVDWPQCWSVDQGDQTTEINVQGVKLFADSRTVTQPDAVRAATDAKVSPAAWLEVEGHLRITDGFAIITS